MMKRTTANPAAIHEAEILASLENPYIVKYKDSFIENGQLYLVMENCDRGDLATYIARQMNVPLSEGQVWTIALQLLAGLICIHRQGVLHRDLKSKNIFLTRDGKAKIGDFGVGAAISE